MRKPVSRILVINDETLVLKEFVKGLNAAAKSLDNPLGIVFNGITTARDALKSIEEDGDIQAVIVDDTLYSLKNNGNSSRMLQMSALELVQKITRFRPELDVYILIAKEQEDEVVDALFSEAVDGYFYREERDYRGIYRILNAQMQEKADTPFYDALKSYVFMAKGCVAHARSFLGRQPARQSLGRRFLRIHGRARVRCRSSVSVPMLGFADGTDRRDCGVAEARGESLRGAPDVFRDQRHLDREQGYLSDADRSGREAAARSQLPQVRASRRGSVRGAPGVPRFLALTNVTASSVQSRRRPILRAIEQHSDAEALVLTSCTYDGLRYDLRRSSKAAHAKGIRVVVDEAWYGFARFHPAFRPTALESGADYATQSTHKILSAFRRRA
jgi:arginine decarboxylase